MNIFKRKRKPDAEIRPRFGEVHHVDGTVELLTFEPDPKRPDAFIAYLAADHTPLMLDEGDWIKIDVLGAGQSFHGRFLKGSGLYFEERNPRAGA